LTWGRLPDGNGDSPPAVAISGGIHRVYPELMFNGLTLRTVALTGVMVLLFTACSGESRPSVEEWQPTWQGVVTGFPTPEMLGEPPDHTVCSHALGVLRSESSDLIPTPDLAIDDVVTDWLKIAEDTVFECPPSNQTIPNLEYAYGELARLEAEVAVVLAIDSESG
jgi:hypothetical protein